MWCIKQNVLKIEFYLPGVIFGPQLCTYFGAIYSIKRFFGKKLLALLGHYLALLGHFLNVVHKQNVLSFSDLNYVLIFGAIW